VGDLVSERCQDAHKGGQLWHTCTAQVTSESGVFTFCFSGVELDNFFFVLSFATAAIVEAIVEPAKETDLLVLAFG